jgi:acyl transferase domain-containing protein/acyl carrier protein
VFLPPYPWQRERFWLDTPSQLALATHRRGGVTDSANAHPILGARVEYADRPGVYSWEVVIDEQSVPYLLEHRIGGAPLLPASASIELLLSAGREIAEGAAVSLVDIDFRRALVIPPDGTVTIQIIAAPDGADRWSFRVYSRAENSWRLHTTAILEQVAGDPRDEVPARVVPPDEDLHSADLYEALQTQGLEIGSSLRTVAQCWCNGRTTLGRLSFPSIRANELARYSAHPAVLDGLFQLTAAAGALRDVNGGGELLVPTHIDRVTLRRPLESAMWAEVIEETDEAGEGGKVRQNLRLVDAEGRSSLQITGVRSVGLDHSTSREPSPADSRSRGSLTDWLFELKWERKRLDPHLQSPSTAGDVWIVLSDTTGVGENLAEQLRHQGNRVVVLPAGDSRSLAAVCDESRPAGIIHLAGLDIEQPPSFSGDDSGARLIESVLDVIHAIPQDGSRRPRIWLVTRGAQPVERGAPVAMGQVPLWGLGRAIAEEHHDSWGGMVDLDPLESLASAAARILSVIRGDGEDQVAFRNGERHVLRLVRTEAPARRTHTMSVRANATYLIAGGLGDIGLHVARWLVESGARRLILMGRTGLPPRCEWTRLEPGVIGDRVTAVRRLEAMGASVHIAAIDVTDRPRLAAFLADFEREAWPPIRGVVQCAGILEGQLLDELDAASLQHVLSPKVDGSWNLHELTAPLPLDFFVLFSSITSILVSLGQGAYAAANVFQDALAAHRIALGLPALSISWAPWEGTRAAVVAERGVGFSTKGIQTLDPDEALGALARLIGGSPAHVAVAPLDWKKWCASSAAREAIPPFYSRLAAGQSQLTGASEPVADTRAPTHIVERLAATAADRRQTVLETFLQEGAARILKCAPAAIDVTRPFRVMGLDSLMALEFRNHLESSFAIKLPATLAWNYPTVTALARHLIARLAGDSVKPVPAPAGLPADRSGDVERLLAEIEQLSDAEARQLAMESAERS